MSKTKFAVVLMGLGLAFVQMSAFAGATWGATTGAQYVPDQILVKFKPGVAAAARSNMAQAYGAKSMQAVGPSDLVLANLVPGVTVDQAVKTYAGDPNVEYAQPNYIYHAFAVPTDPQYATKLWAAKNTGQTISPASYATNNPGVAGNDMTLETAWDLQTDCSSVVVAVVDTGINYNSQDLTTNMWPGNAKHGQNFATDVTTGVGSDPMDLNGHGTHVAGIIGAVANNGFGGAGVCWNAQLMAVRVLDARGSGNSVSIAQGVDYAVANGAKVINMSLGGSSYDPTFNTAITNAQNNGVLVVVAAGNENNNNETSARYPCNYTQSNLICVAALDQSYARASFSNYGATSVDVGAPGTNIYSTWAGTEAVITDTFAAGWTGSSTTSGTGGGWYTGSTYLFNPGPAWGGASPALYNANTDDRAYKTFNLGTTATVAYLDMDIAINVKNGDYFRINSLTTAGDPFAGGGTAVMTATNIAVGQTFPHLRANISSCITTTCTLGFQLTSTVASTRDIGVAGTNFTIWSMALNSTSYNTIDGTSMATPQVAGVAALVLAHNPLFTYADVAGAIKNGGRSVAALSGITTTGKAVDAQGALTYINPPAGITVTVH